MEAAQHQASELQASNVAHDVNALSTTKRACIRCGKANHSPEECYFRAQTCHKCGKIGHVAKMCRGKKVQGAAKIEKKTNYAQEEPHDRDLGLLQSRRSTGCILMLYR